MLRNRRIDTNRAEAAQGGRAFMIGLGLGFSLLLCGVGALAAQGPAPAPPAHPPAPRACTGGRTALVLSGGGAKGLAHVGLLRALDSLGVRPDLVVGTSMGAIVGALYASGLSGATIDSLARTVPLGRVLNTFEPRAARELGRLQPLVTWEEGARGAGIQTTAVREEVVNALTSAVLLRGNLLAQGDFDRLPIPFRAVATDLRDRSPVVLDRGDLAEAVRASFAIPLVFRPVPLNGRVLADGGLSANIPIAAARAAGATRVLVADVSERVAPDSADLTAVAGVADRLVNFLFLQPLDSLGPDDTYLRTSLPSTPSLDFSPAQVARIIAAGRATADAQLPAAACLPYAPLRAVPLPGRAGRVQLDDAAAAQGLGVRPGDTLALAPLRARLRRFEEDPRVMALWLRPTPDTGGTVAFTPAVTRAPRRTGHLGLVYDSDLGGRLWLGSVDRRLMGTGATATVAAFIGERQREARADLRLPIGLRRVAPGPLGEVRVADEEIRAFDADGTERPSLDTKELTTFLGAEVPLGLAWRVRAGWLGRWWSEPERGNDDALGLLVRAERFSSFAESQLLAEAQVTRAYRRVLLDARTRATVGAVRLFPRVRVAVGDSVPLALSTPLGGLEEGFAGFRFGERRGDREVMAGLTADRRIAGPLFFRLQADLGRVGTGGPLLPRDGWVFGMRGGLALETVLGPMRIEYGANTAGRDALFVRFARWIPHQQ